MAKQNFLAGGYYGKLGQTVGQRWKNIRTIRTYVIPHDPKTPAQIVQRTRFKDNVLFSQAAMMSNYTCTFFVSEKLPAWNIRMSLASELYRQTDYFLSKLPLCPLANTPPYVITKVAATYDATAKNATIKLTGNLPTTARKYCIYLTNNPTTQDPNDVLLLGGETTTAAPDTITTTPFEDFTIDNNTHIRIVSVDDENSFTDMVLSSELVNGSEAKPVVAFNTDILNAVTVGAVTTIEFAQQSFTGSLQVDVTAIIATLNLANRTITAENIHLDNSGTYVKLIFTQSDYDVKNQLALAEGAEIQIASMSLETSNKIFRVENTTIYPLDATATSRTFDKITEQVVSYEDNKIKLSFVSDYANYITPPDNLLIDSERNGNQEEINWELTNTEKQTGNVQAEYSAPIPNGKTRNQYGGVAPYWNDTTKYGIQAFQQSVNGVTYTIEAPLADAKTGAFTWSFTPNYAAQAVDGKVLYIVSDIATFPASLLSQNINLSYDTNVNGLTGKTYANTASGVVAASGDYLAISADQPATSPLACQIDCYTKTTDYVINTDYADYTINAVENIPFFNAVDTVQPSQWWTSNIGEFHYGVSGDEDDLKVSTPMCILFNKIRNNNNLPATADFGGNNTRYFMLVFEDEDENEEELDLGGKCGWENGLFKLASSVSCPSFPNTTFNTSCYMHLSFYMSLSASNDKVFKISYNGKTVYYAFDISTGSMDIGTTSETSDFWIDGIVDVEEI